MMTPRVLSFSYLLLGAHFMQQSAYSQGTAVEFNTPGPGCGSTIDPANYPGGFVPSWEVGEEASIEYGGCGYVDTDLTDLFIDGFSANPGGLHVGWIEFDGTSSVECRDGCNANITNAKETSGDLNIGPWGEFDVFHGGSFNVESATVVAPGAQLNVDGSFSTGNMVNNGATIINGTANVKDNLFSSRESLVYWWVDSNSPSDEPAVRVENDAFLFGSWHGQHDQDNDPPVSGDSVPLALANNFIFGEDFNLEFSGLPPDVKTIHVREYTPEGQVLSAKFVPALTASVDRNDGDVEVTNTTTGPITIDLISLRLDDGFLDSSAWPQAIKDGLGPDWLDANSDEYALNTVLRDGFKTIHPGETIVVKGIYDPLRGLFGEQGDLRVTIGNSDGKYDAHVEYTGTKVNNLALRIDPVSGEAVIKNPSETTVGLDFYLIESPSLVPQEAWSPLADTVGEGWGKIVNAEENIIGEAKRAGSTMVAPGEEHHLGTIFTDDSGSVFDNMSQEEIDEFIRLVDFEFSQPGQSVPTTGVIIFSDPCDFDLSDSLDVGDIEPLRMEIIAGTNNPFYDVTSDGKVDLEDLEFFIGDASKLNTFRGDSNLDGEFNDGDMVEMSNEGKWDTGQPATWRQGDKNADGVFDSKDMVYDWQEEGFNSGPKSGTSVAALAAAPDPSPGPVEDGVALVYDPTSGALAVMVDETLEITALEIESLGNLFTGDQQTNLDGVWDIFRAGTLFKLVELGFGDIAFGAVLPTGLTGEQLLADLIVDGALVGGGDLSAAGVSPVLVHPDFQDS